MATRDIAYYTHRLGTNLDFQNVLQDLTHATYSLRMRLDWMPHRGRWWVGYTPHAPCTRVRHDTSTTSGWTLRAEPDPTKPRSGCRIVASFPDVAEYAEV